MEDRLLKPRDAANLLGLSESTLAKLRLSGGGPEYLKLGRSIRYARKSLDTWIAARARRSTSDIGITDAAAVGR
jgi:predicted DNA-binding transcriptional regulator AlpA